MSDAISAALSLAARRALMRQDFATFLRLAFVSLIRGRSCKWRHICKC